MLRLVAVVTVMACLALTTVAVARDATWSIRYPPTDGLESVSCTSPEACTAVGGGFGPFAARWDGLRWHYERVIDPASPNAMNPSKLYGVACTSSTACIAVGEYDKDRCGPSYGGCQAATLPIAERWNGARWTLQSTPNLARYGLFNQLDAISCAGPRMCVAVGARGDNALLAERWDGSRWSQQSIPTGSISAKNADIGLASVSCPSSRNCMAVGTLYGNPGQPLVERWDGVRWSAELVATPPGFGGGLQSVSCTSSTACTAVGNYYGGYGSLLPGGPLIERWDGTAWSRQAAPDLAADARLTGVSCASGTTCTLVGTLPSATTLVERWDGISWKHEPTQGPSGVDQGNAYLVAVSCPTTVNCIAVGSSNGGAVALQRTAGPLSAKRRASAKLTGIPRACVIARFTAHIDGTEISAVRWLIDGKRTGGRTLQAGTHYAASISPSTGSHRLTVEVRFQASTHASPRIFRRAVSVCPTPTPRVTG